MNAQKQIAAVLREYADAVKDKNTELALRILRANPDIFEKRGKP